MAFETLINSSATWLWDECFKWIWDDYGKAIAQKAADNLQSKKTVESLQNKWVGFRWGDAEINYRKRVYSLYSTTRLLGYPKPINIEGIFTDVYVLNRLTAFRRFDLDQLQARPFERDSLRLEDDRKHALRIVMLSQRLFILGKPGAGKTTFLKYLTLQACLGKIPLTPIFLSLKEWTDSGLDLEAFLVKQFEICAFPDAKLFIKWLLAKGKAMVLFDGLDEVKQEGDQRAQMINALTTFAAQHPDVKTCITCRVAATDYSFAQFTYMEVADFDEKQIRQFASKWYYDHPSKFQQFIAEISKPENQGLRELAQTPLLLALLCLAFDETLSFPTRRVDLYKDALDALLKKWDSSRNIRRDDIYRKLSPGRKEQLLSRVAAMNFEAGVYFVRQGALVSQIQHYLHQLPDSDKDEKVDGEAVLRAIEAQHGLLVERAHGIYSFSHLTFQEYFTARYVVENAAEGTIKRLVESHLTDDRWREVFLLTTSMLDNADLLFESCIRKLANVIEKDRECIELLRWADDKSKLSNQTPMVSRAGFILIALILEEVNILERYRTKPIPADHERALNKANQAALDLIKASNRRLADSLASLPSSAFQLVRNGGITEPLGVRLPTRDFSHEWHLSTHQIHRLTTFLTGSQMVAEVLRLAVVSDRSRIENRLLVAPK